MPMPENNRKHLSKAQLACGFEIHDAITSTLAQHKLSAEDALPVFQSIISQLFRRMRDAMIANDVALPDRFFWQVIGQLAHELAHAPDNWPLESDQWLHPGEASERHA